MQYTDVGDLPWGIAVLTGFHAGDLIIINNALQEGEDHVKDSDSDCCVKKNLFKKRKGN